MLFHSADKMQVMAHGVIKAMTLHKEAIKDRTSPSATHVRAYMVVVNGELLGSQTPTPDREKEPQLSPSDPHPGGRTWHQLQANLGVDELQQFMEDLCQEVALRELNTPQGSTQPLGEIKWEMGILMWMPRRSPFQEGEGGNPQDNHFDPLLPLNQMEGGNPEDNLFDPLPALNLMKMWDVL